jgi:uncharacterized membrane protein
MKKLYPVSIIFGAAPLIIGVSVFIVWYFSKAEFLEIAGIFTILGGLVSVVVAAISLIIYLWYQSKKDKFGKVLFKKVALSADIIILNFPVAFICMVSALNILTAYVLTIKNNSELNIDKVQISAPGINNEIKLLKPGEEISLDLDFKGDGILEFAAMQEHKRVEGVVESYVTGSMGGYGAILFQNNGEYIIIQDDD